MKQKITPEELLEKEKLIRQNRKKTTKEHYRYHIKYPKFLMLILSFVAAYFLFEYLNIFGLNEFISSLGYFGIILAGKLFSSGCTAAPAIALF